MSTKMGNLSSTGSFLFRNQWRRANTLEKVSRAFLAQRRKEMNELYLIECDLKSWKVLVVFFNTVFQHSLNLQNINKKVTTTWSQDDRTCFNYFSRHEIQCMQFYLPPQPINDPVMYMCANNKSYSFICPLKKKNYFINVRYLFHVSNVSKWQMHVIFSSLRWSSTNHFTSSVFRVHKVSEEWGGTCHYWQLSIKRVHFIIELSRTKRSNARKNE